MGKIKGIYTKDEIIKKQVAKLIKKHKTRNPLEIIKGLDIGVIFHDLGNVNGLYQKVGRVKIIHINNRLKSEFQTYVLAHELGHAILHPNENYLCLSNASFDKTNIIETEADTFASELLIDDNYIQYTDYTLEQVAAIYNVPEYILKRKFPKKFFS